MIPTALSLLLILIFFMAVSTENGGVRVNNLEKTPKPSPPKPMKVKRKEK